MQRDKRVAWITGGGTGIGLGGASALARDGWTVVISGRRQDVLEAAAEKLGKEGGNVSAKAMDVSNAADAQRVADEIVGQEGRIDLLVNSAGLNVRNRSWSDMTIESWDQVVSINYDGLLYCMKSVLPTMRAQQDGCIVNVASWTGRIVSQMAGPAYTSAKHAVMALTHSFNMDEFRNGIRACALSPGEVATPILKARPVPVSEEDMARMLSVEDVGRIIAFIASMPKHVCINEVLVSPTWNRVFMMP